MPRLGTLLLPLGAEACALLLLSRLLFGGVVAAFANRRGKGLWLAVLRLPGNFVHEYSHALGFWLCGYRVKHVLLCLFDPQGRGSCAPSRPWSPIAFPLLATGLAALMPLVTGSLVLGLAAHYLGVFPATQAGAPASLGTLGAQVLVALDGLNWHTWRTYVFLYLAVSVGAELAPSNLDLRYALPALVVSVAGVWLFFFGLTQAPGLRAFSQTAHVALATGAHWLSALWLLTLTIVAVAAVLTLVPGAVLRAIRGR